MDQLPTGNRPRQGIALDTLPTDSNGPSEQAMHREAVADLAGVLRSLPSNLRTPFLLRTEQSLSFRDIAAILGLTEATARWRVCTARQRLMKDLAVHLGPI